MLIRDQGRAFSRLPNRRALAYKRRGLAEYKAPMPPYRAGVAVVHFTPPAYTTSVNVGTHPTSVGSYKQIRFAK